jgi:hypothetical protein
MTFEPLIRWNEPPEVYRETMRGMGMLVLRPIAAFGVLWVAICAFYAYRTASQHPERLGSALTEAGVLTAGYVVLTAVLVGRLLFRLSGSSRSTTFEMVDVGLRSVDGDEVETYEWPDILAFRFEDHPTIAGVRSLVFQTEAEGWDQWVLPMDPADRQAVEDAVREHLSEVEQHLEAGDEG